MDRWAIVANSSWMQGKRYSIAEGTLVIGRSAQADITLPSNHLSRQHAQLVRNGDAIVLQDMASMNGTFLNGNRVRKASLKAGDQLRFDTFTFLVEGPAEEVKEEIVEEPPRRHFSAAKIAHVKRSTSPGNRVVPRKKPATVGLTILGTVLTAGCLGYLIYLVFFT